MGTYGKVRIFEGCSLNDCPLSGNIKFKGIGEGLPGHGPELVINPSVSTKDNLEVKTISKVHVH